MENDDAPESLPNSVENQDGSDIDLLKDTSCDSDTENSEKTTNGANKGM